MSDLLKKADRPLVLNGRTYKIKTGCGKVYIVINRDQDGRIFELFIKAAKAGGCMAAQTSTIGILISHIARHGLDIEPLIVSLGGMSCKERLQGKDMAQSCADAIAKAIEKDIEAFKETQPEQLDIDTDEEADNG